MHLDTNDPIQARMYENILLMKKKLKEPKKRIKKLNRQKINFLTKNYFII